MGGDEAKIRKKEAKASVKRAKAESRSRAPGESGPGGPDGIGLPEGVGVVVRRSGDSSELVVSGLADEQLAREPW